MVAGEVYFNTSLCFCKWFATFSWRRDPDQARLGATPLRRRLRKIHFKQRSVPRHHGSNEFLMSTRAAFDKEHPDHVSLDLLPGHARDQHCQRIGQVHRLIDARAKEVVGDGEGKQQGQTPRNLPL